MFYQTTATKKIKRLTKRIRGIPGGTSASKTISILIYLIALAQSDEKPTITSVISESMPHLKRGAIRDFKNIMMTQGYWKRSRWNATDSIYTFETGSQMEFFSSDNADKLRGGRRHRAFFNEANNVSFEAFEQIEMRTMEFVIADWNPTNEFWWYTEVKVNRDDWEELTLTFRDNEALDERIVKSILQRRHRKSWWRVYGMGKLGEVEGKIFRGWRILDQVPHGARLIRYVVDFGYTNDPTAILAMYEYNGGYIFDELAYRKGMLNSAIANVILNQEEVALVVADCAEPKSIDELKLHGLTVVGSKKGADSVINGIEAVQSVKIWVTKRSTYTIKEYRNYLFKVDKDGKILNVPEDEYNHSMDAIRYGVASVKQPEKRGTKVNRPRYGAFNKRLVTQKAPFDE